MDKAGIAQALEEIGTLLELKDENPFKIRAYANAARSLEAWGGATSPTCRMKKHWPKFRESAKQLRPRSKSWLPPVH